MINSRGQAHAAGGGAPVERQTPLAKTLSLPTGDPARYSVPKINDLPSGSMTIGICR